MPSLFSEGHAQFGKKAFCLHVRLGCCHNRDAEPHNLLDLIEIDFRKNNLLGQTKRIIPMAIEAIRIYTTKILNTRKSTFINLSRNSHIWLPLNVTRAPIS